MKLLHHNKNLLNKKIFSKSNYFVLSYEQLLKVNGAGSSSSSTSPSGPSGGYGTCAGGGATTSSSTGTGGYGTCAGGGAITPSSSSNNTQTESIQQKILNSINENKDKKYIIGTYQCDNWVQEVLTDAGYDYNNYFAGEAQSKTCEEHIAALKEGTYTTSTPTEAGVYVVLMNDGHKYTKSDGTTGTLAAHTGILVIGDGNPYFYDNSSGNNNKTGGIEKTTGGTTSSSVMNQFGYDSFYYQKIQ